MFRMRIKKTLRVNSDGLAEPRGLQRRRPEPSGRFRDPWLKECVVELKPGKPWPWPRSGTHAIVYRLYKGSRSTAVRVFMSEPRTDRQSRYLEVHAYFDQTKPACMVEFKYEPEGILVNAQRLPILTMEWVEGKTLGIWFREAVERNDRPGDQADGSRVDQACRRAPLSLDRTWRPPARQRHGRG